MADPGTWLDVVPAGVQSLKSPEDLKATSLQSQPPAMTGSLLCCLVPGMHISPAVFSWDTIIHPKP